ncbi:MAG: D-glycerate dehydrogenase [Firmicutes bacterium]|nr:D-glycerate dehydrogenase [Bacillota bacterium]
MKPVVFVSARISKEALQLLQEHCTVHLNDKKGTPLTSAELLQAAKDVQGLLCAFNDRVDRDFISQATNLKVISSFTAGVNNIDLQAATEHKIIVTNTSSAVADTKADLTWGLLIAVARRIVEGDRYVKREKKGQSKPPGSLNGADLVGKTLGIIGMGHFGQCVACRAKGLVMPVLFYQRRQLTAEEEKELNASYATLEELLQKSDYVTLHLPLTEETRHLISAKELRMMKKSAFLINTSRGPVVDEKALLQALQEKRIAGAGIDVYEKEPEITPGLTELDNIVLTPHIGGSTMGTQKRMALLAAQNLIDVLQGRRPRHVVNPEVLE